MPVVGESWLVESRASKRLVDPWLHLLKVIFSFLHFCHLVNFIEGTSCGEKARDEIGRKCSSGQEPISPSRLAPTPAFFSCFYLFSLDCYTLQC